MDKRTDINPGGLRALCRAMLMQAAGDMIHSAPGLNRYEEGKRFLQSEFAENAAEMVGFDIELLIKAAEQPDALDRIISARGKKNNEKHTFSQIRPKKSGTA